MTKIKTFAVIGLSIALGACSLFPRATPDPIDPDQTELVARDFVDALSKLRGYTPRNTTVQLRPTTSKFSESLEGEIRNAGYGMQMIPSNDTGPLLVTYESESYENTSGKSVGYRIRVGSVELAREYEIRSGRVFPMTGMSVKGVAISSEPLDGTIFERNRFAEVEAPGTESIVQSTGLGASGTVYDSLITKPRAQRPLLRQPAASPNPIVIVDSSSTNESHLEAIPSVTNDSEWQTVGSQKSPTEQSGIHQHAHTETAEASPQTFHDRVKINMLQRGESNHERVFEKYTIVSQVVLEFPNDSAVLGRENKNTIYKNVAVFDPDTDILSVIGCSHGKTKINNGNAFLSNGRANRVKEELIVASVPPHLIFEEGCWSGTAEEGHPGRGVILTHRRLSSNVSGKESPNG